MQYIYERDKINYFKKFSFIAGNILIILTLIGFAYIYYPFLYMYMNPPVIQSITETKGLSITIPKINAQASIITEVNPLDQNIYTSAFEKGVAHVKGSAQPGENGTTVLLAHSSGLPWQLTRVNTAFFQLSEIETQDTIIISKDGEEKAYYVWNKKEVWPDEVAYLVNAVKGNGSQNQLILQTCTPVGTSFKRLLIFAAPK